MRLDGSILLAVLLAVLLAATACNSPARDVLIIPTAPTSTVPMGTDFTLAPGESVVVNSSDLTLTFVGLTGDSRCPIDVQCVWAGSAIIAVRTRSASGTREFPLETLSNKDTATVDQSLVQLVSVAPRQSTTSKYAPSSYRATLRIVHKD